MLTAAEVIAHLNLKPLPIEGGFFRETYRSEDRLPAEALPRYGQAKSAGTAIYYLLQPGACSCMHRLPTDEIYHFYLGDPVRMLQLGPGGGRVVTLGNDLRAGQLPQLVVPRGVWQGSALVDGGGFALLGTTMAPGFDFTDFEAADRAALQAEFPAFAELIAELTP